MATDKWIHLPCTYKEWPKLKTDLCNLAEKKITGLDAFDAILKENDRWENIHLPHALLRRVLKEDKFFTQEYFCETLMPWIAGKAVQVEELFKESEYRLMNLFKGVQEKVTLTRDQFCCLLSLAFFNAFEPINYTYQQFTLAGFLSFHLSASQRNKLLCLLNYFERVRKLEEDGNKDFLSLCITVARKQLEREDPEVAWGECTTPLLAFESFTEGRIEDAHGSLQVDFANEYIGGGVLNMGNVQEEIRFVINPECLVSILFCQKMDDFESILITGAEQFSVYSGYGGRFTCKGPHEDINPVDDRNRRNVNIIAIDAIPFEYEPPMFQYKRPNIVRELNKAYCGFTHVLSGDKSDKEEVVSVATGNWGCGMFGGDKELKSLIQWMAASRAGRTVQYYTFGDANLTREQERVTKLLLERKVTVGQLYKILVSGSMSKGNVFEYVVSAYK